MPILKSSSKSKGINGKMVGVLFPMDLHSYFSLFALAKGLTKSTIVKQQMDRWYDLSAHATEGKPENLIAELIAKIKDEWDLVKNETSLIHFKRELKNELRRKGVCEEHIKIILKNIE